MTQKRSRRTREKVLEAARNLIVEHGHEQVSLKEICERSGVSNGSIFHHFGSKEGIVRELFAAERAAYLGVIRNAIMQYDGDPCDAFAAGTRAALHYQAKNPGPFGRLIAEFSDSEWLRRNVDLWLAVASEEESPVIAWLPSISAAAPCRAYPLHSIRRPCLDQPICFPALTVKEGSREILRNWEMIWQNL